MEVIKIRDAAEALDYLMLGPDEKIQYRVERGISLQDWHRSFGADLLEGNLVQSQDVRRIYGTMKQNWSKIIVRGDFGEQIDLEGTVYLRTENVNRALQQDARTVPNAAFEDICQNGAWSMPYYTYSREFGELFEKVPARNKWGVSLLNAARISRKMRRRKEKIEDWYTLQDLADALDWEIRPISVAGRAARMHERGELHYEKAPKYNLDGKNRGGSQLKIPPAEFHRVVKRERKLQEAQATAVTSTELAKLLGIRKDYARDLMHAGEKLGLFERIRLTYDERNPRGDQFGVSPDVADNIVEGRFAAKYKRNPIFGIKDAAEALDYLMLGPDEKINFRVEKRTSIQNWYENFSIEPLEGDEIPSMDVARMFGQNRSSWTKTLRSGAFDEPVVRKGRNYLKIGNVNAIIAKQAKLVPNTAFRDVYESGKWYMSQHVFDRFYNVLFKKLVARRGYGILIVDAAKIAQEMRLRKEQIEKWKTFEDLQHELGWNYSQTTLAHRLEHLHSRGEIEYQRVPNYDANGKAGTGSRLKICPTEFRRFVQWERESEERARTSVTSTELADRLGLTRRSDANYLMKAGEDLGLFTRIELNHSKVSGGHRYGISPEVADKIVAGELVISNYRNLEQKSAEEIERLAVRAGARLNALTLREISERSGLGYNRISTLVRRGIQAGLLHPIGQDETTRRNEQKLIPRDEAERLIRGELTIPTPGEIQRLALYNSANGKVPLSSRLEIMPRIEEGIRKKVRDGDPTAYRVLVQIYGPILSELAETYRFGATRDEQRLFLETALFEIMTEVGVRMPQERIVSLLELKLVERIKEEKPSWISIDRHVKDGSQRRLVDIIPDTGSFWH